MNAASGADQLIPGGGGGLSPRSVPWQAKMGADEWVYSWSKPFFFHASSRSKLFFLSEKILFFPIYIIVYIYILLSTDFFYFRFVKLTFFFYQKPITVLPPPPPSTDHLVDRPLNLSHFGKDLCGLNGFNLPHCFS